MSDKDYVCDSGVCNGLCCPAQALKPALRQPVTLQRLGPSLDRPCPDDALQERFCTLHLVWKTAPLGISRDGEVAFLRRFGHNPREHED